HGFSLPLIAPTAEPTPVQTGVEALCAGLIRQCWRVSACRWVSSQAGEGSCLPLESGLIGPEASGKLRRSLVGLPLEPRLIGPEAPKRLRRGVVGLALEPALITRITMR